MQREGELFQEKQLWNIHMYVNKTLKNEWQWHIIEFLNRNSDSFCLCLQLYSYTVVHACVQI